MREHRVLDGEQAGIVAPALRGMTPWPAVGSVDFCKNVDGANKVAAGSHREAVERIRDDIRRYRETSGIENLVVVNLASVERWPDKAASALHTPEGFEKGLDSSDPAISPAMLYAYASITEGVPYGNFTPSLAADIPALTTLAERRNVPVAGKDGKTGQTFIKTVLAPAFRSRSLYVDGWFSTNILGNRDGLALDNPDSLKSKLNTKGSVLEIARVLDLARQRGKGGIQEQLGLFFKAPMTPAGKREEHSFPVQERALLDWLAA